MPKQPKRQSTRLADFVRLFPCLKTDGSALFCKPSNKPVSSEKIFSVKQHMKCASHMENVNKLEPQSNQQQFLQESIEVSKTDLFNKDLCKAFAAADIPFYKLNNMVLKAFLEKYMSFQLPSKGTLRRGLSESYKSTLQDIRMVARNEYLWISIDETTDSSKRCIANVVVGILNCDTNRTSKTFLLNVAVLDRVNQSSIARLFDESVNLLGAEFKNFVLLLVSDAAPCLVKAADGIWTAPGL